MNSFEQDSEPQDVRDLRNYLLAKYMAFDSRGKRYEEYSDGEYGFGPFCDAGDEDGVILVFTIRDQNRTEAYVVLKEDGDVFYTEYGPDDVLVQSGPLDDPYAAILLDDLQGALR